MSDLLLQPPFSERDDARLLMEMNDLSRWHLGGCAAYRAVWPAFDGAADFAELPFLHVGAFKDRVWKTEADGISHQRTLRSSSTGGTASRIVLDDRSGALQARSSAAILADLLGPERRPLVVLDAARSLQQRGEAGARIAAAMSLRPLASELHFVLADAASPDTLDWSAVADVCSRHSQILVYGFTWMLWSGWAKGAGMPEVREALRGARVDFVHSGGWKRLEAIRVERREFDQALLATVGPGSGVLDFYGLVEQIGVIFPLCEAGFRHVPRWARVLVRDPWTLETLSGAPGLLQLMNPLALGAPYHNVLTEDMGRLVEGPCPCGRRGQRFELLGRMPKAEVRGCANV